MNSKSTQIKRAVAKIDINKIVAYSQEYPQSKTLRQIVNYSKRVQASNSEQEIFKLGAGLAYYLDTICDPNKGGYVKNEKEKKHWLEISRELFENTIGIRE
jgi:hypothetical protein